MTAAGEPAINEAAPSQKMALLVVLTSTTVTSIGSEYSRAARRCGNLGCRRRQAEVLDPLPGSFFKARSSKPDRVCSSRPAMEMLSSSEGIASTEWGMTGKGVSFRPARQSGGRSTAPAAAAAQPSGAVQSAIGAVSAAAIWTRSICRLTPILS
jgi:hypothetical protein